MDQEELVSDGRAPSMVVGEFSYTPPGSRDDPDVWARGVLMSMFEASGFKVELSGAILTLNAPFWVYAFRHRSPDPADFVGSGVVEVRAHGPTAMVRYRFKRGVIAKVRLFGCIGLALVIAIPSASNPEVLANSAWTFAVLALGCVWTWFGWRAENGIGRAMEQQLREMAHDD